MNYKKKYFELRAQILKKVFKNQLFKIPKKYSNTCL